MADPRWTVHDGMSALTLERTPRPPRPGELFRIESSLNQFYVTRGSSLLAQYLNGRTLRAAPWNENGRNECYFDSLGAAEAALSAYFDAHPYEDELHPEDW